MPGGKTRTAKRTWKDKFTEEQLERKRAADRQLVCQSRCRTRKTIQTLQEQVRLLSDQQCDQVVTDLMNTNKALEETQTTLMSRLYAISKALCLNKEDAHALITQKGTVSLGIAQKATEGAPSYDDNSAASELTEIRGGFDLLLELDARIPGANSPSPFPSIKALIAAGSDSAPVSEEALLDSAMLWRRTCEHGSSVYDLACHLLHIHRQLGCMTRTRLKQPAPQPGLLPRIIDLLESFTPGSQNPPVYFFEELEAPSPQDGLATIRKEIIICAYEAVRHWHYCSKVARVAMFWALYRILLLLILPTAQNLAKCPTWFRPTASQMLHDHPSFIVFIPWPQMREHLVRSWSEYLESNLYSLFVETFDIDIGQDMLDQKVLSMDPTGSDLVLHPAIDCCLSRLSSLTAKDTFLRRFPEFAGAIRPASPQPLIGSPSFDDQLAALATPPPPSPGLIVSEEDQELANAMTQIPFLQQPYETARTITTDSSCPEGLPPLGIDQDTFIPDTWQFEPLQLQQEELHGLSDGYWPAVALESGPLTRPDIGLSGKFFIV